MDKKNFFSKVKMAESTISMILGIVVVVVVGILLFRYFKNNATTNTNIPQISNEAAVSEINGDNTTGVKGKVEELAGNQKTNEGTSTSTSGKYIVKKGDNLWNISIKYYKTGYEWKTISKANNLKNPGVIEVGQELTIPEIPVQKTIAQNPTGKNLQPITSDKYTVVKGDNLWNISVRAYQDGFKWQIIAQANNIVNPRRIHPGNVLTIPRQ